MKNLFKAVPATLAALVMATTLHAQDASTVTNFRPPAVPLVACDPYFSIWSNTNQLTDSPTRHWTGRQHRLTSMVRIDGQTFRIMGDNPSAVAALKQTNLAVSPTRSIYTFEGSGVQVQLTFMTPQLLDDLLTASKPLTYVTWTARSTDGANHNVEVYFDAGSELAVNVAEQEVTFGRESISGLQTLKVGSVDQPVLATRGDDHRIDWGYFYLSVPTDGATTHIRPAREARSGFASAQAIGEDSKFEGQSSRAPVLAATIKLGSVGSAPVSKHAILAYDDLYSIRYFNEDLKPYWKKDGATVKDLIQSAEKNYAELVKRCEAFDTELVADLRKLGGESYAQLGVLAWRQALAAQKICADSNGQPLSFSKENFSNGCIATVDVIYPAAPQMIVFSPTLMKASLVPLLDFSASPRWKDRAAPHDLGTYPHATGQVYGDGTISPMPVEESGNMLILMGALAKVEGNADFSKKYWKVLSTWNEYLVEKGLDPENQLCTDDFAGHIARNANLSVKAIMGIASYAMLADMIGEKETAAKYNAIAKDYAKKWMDMGKASGGDHYKLVFGDAGNNTWSQKYNLVWDTLLDLDIFPAEVRQKEMAFYMTKMNKYGLPLDSRRSYTKLDWELWTATMADNKEHFQKIVDACSVWLNETNSRVPMTDWYETDTGKQSGFQARSVVGGLFIPFIKDKALWKKYASRDKTQLTSWASYNFMPPPTKVVIPTAETESATWRYTTGNVQGDAWTRPGFNDSSWSSGQSGFGTRGTPGAKIGTEWNTPSIFLRREFEMPAGSLNNPRFSIHHDEDVEVYLNGVLAYKARGFVGNYFNAPITKEALATLKPGKNILAVKCRQTIGGQYVDVGIVDLLPHEKK